MKKNPVTHLDRSGPDSRYEVSLEYIGRNTARHVARFRGEWLGQSKFYASAMMLCVGESNVRNGAEIITEKTKGTK